MGTIIIVTERITRDDHTSEVPGALQFTKHFHRRSHGSLCEVHGWRFSAEAPRSRLLAWHRQAHPPGSGRVPLPHELTVSVPHLSIYKLVPRAHY